MEKQSRFPDKQTAVFERMLPGPIARVWDYLTRAEYLATWFADGEIGEAGTRYKLNQDSPRVPLRRKGGMVGTVKLKEKPHKLVITFAGVGDLNEKPAEESLVTFELKEEGKQVRLKITHERITKGFLAMVGTGWQTHVSAMAAELSGEKPSDRMAYFQQLLPEYLKNAEAAGDEMTPETKAMLESVRNGTKFTSQSR